MNPLPPHTIQLAHSLITFPALVLFTHWLLLFYSTKPFCLLSGSLWWLAPVFGVSKQPPNDSFCTVYNYLFWPFSLLPNKHTSQTVLFRFFINISLNRSLFRSCKMCYFLYPSLTLTFTYSRQQWSLRHVLSFIHKGWNNIDYVLFPIIYKCDAKYSTGQWPFYNRTNY